MVRIKRAFRGDREIVVVGGERVAERILWQTIFRSCTDPVKRAIVGARGATWLQRQTVLHIGHQAVVAEDEHIGRGLRETLAYRLRKRQTWMMILEPAPCQTAQPGGKLIASI